MKKCKICGMMTSNTYEVKPVCEPCQGKYGIKLDDKLNGLKK